VACRYAAADHLHAHEKKDGLVEGELRRLAVGPPEALEDRVGLLDHRDKGLPPVSHPLKIGPGESPSYGFPCDHPLSYIIADIFMSIEKLKRGPAREYGWLSTTEESGNARFGNIIFFFNGNKNEKRT